MSNLGMPVLCGPHSAPWMRCVGCGVPVRPPADYELGALPQCSQCAAVRG